METPHENKLLTGAAACGEEPKQEHIFWQDL